VLRTSFSLKQTLGYFLSSLSQINNSQIIFFVFYFLSFTFGGFPAIVNAQEFETISEPSSLSIKIQKVKAIAPRKIAIMSLELEELIGRFESTLLAAEANSTSADLSTGKAMEELVSNSDKKTQRQNPSKISSTVKNSAYKVLLEARKKQQKFLELVEQKEYNLAKQEWAETQKLLLANYPIDRQLAEAEIRAIWLDRGTIVQSKSESDLARIFDGLAAAGINTVFFETLNASYTIYPSKIAPEQNPLTKGWDPLKSAVKLAHDRGMELHAWVWIFAAANQPHNKLLAQPTNYLGPVLSAHPDWAMTDKKGKAFQESSKKAFFDPANPGVKNYLLSLLEEIATRYQVDGIQLDYIRYPFQEPKASQVYSYGLASRQSFIQLTGVDPIVINSKHPLWTEWIKFRTQQINDFVSSTSERLKSKRPDLVLSAAVFPLPQGERLSRLQQNWEEWAEKKWVNLIVPMTYVIDTPELQQKTRLLFDRSFPKSVLVLPGIRLLNVPDVMVVDKMQLLRHMPAGGYALFAAENFNSNLQKILSVTQGSTKLKQKEPLPHRQPFHAAATRYQGLQKEWSWLLASNQLKMETKDMKEWSEKADYLSMVLKRLAEDPSPRHYLSVEIALDSFQRRFGIWMEQFKEVRPYQVQAWENRIEALERLVNYGQQTVLPKTKAKVAKK
jgi:uncharacterized lipoprotein YddW (UPF0748 family)